MKTIKLESITIMPAGYGHNTITIDVYHGGDFEVLDTVEGGPLYDAESERWRSYKSTTNNTRLTDRIKGNSYSTADDPKDYLEALKEAAELVLDAHGVQYDDIEVSSRYSI